MRQRVVLFGGLGLQCLAVVWAIALILVGSNAQSAAQLESSEPTPTPGSLSSLIAPGSVGMVLRLDRMAAAGGLLTRGDHVDIYATYPGASGGLAPTSRLLLGDVEIFDSSIEGDVQAVTLAIPPQQAIQVQYATSVGAKPFVLLRSSGGRPGLAASTAFSADDLAAWVLSGAAAGATN